MPQPALSHAHLESDLRRLDELIAFVGGMNSEEAALLMEHLHSARIYLLGAMPDEYAASLQSAKEASQWVRDKPLRDALMEALSYLQSETSHLEASRGNEWHHQTHPKQHDPAPPGTTSKLWSFFSTSDTSFGIFYPKQQVVAVLPSFEAAKAAEMALRNDGFGDDEILAASGSEMLKFMEELRLQAGWWGELMRGLSRTLGTEEIFVDNYIRWGREGVGFLAVNSPMEIESERICRLLLPFRPIAIERYLSSGIQSLI
jgi:hypothetical protein